MLHKLTFEKVVQVPEYKTNLNLDSSLVKKQHELFHPKAESVLKLRNLENFRLIKTGNLLFLPQKKNLYFTNLSGAHVKKNCGTKELDIGT